MNHRKFVVTSTVSMLVVAGVVLGLTFYSNFAVKASIADLPEALNYLPADSMVVFGMNVDKFVKSSIFAKFQANHGQQIGTDLQELITNTGVDPTKDISYILAAGRSVQGQKGSGVVIALGQFKTDMITTFIKTKVVPIELDYGNIHVVMIPEKDGSKLEKGVAYLKNSEIALGDLDSLKAVIDVISGTAKGVASSPVLGPLLDTMKPQDMFWFAGDPTSILSKAPTNTPFGGSISAIQNIFGTLNLDEAIVGTITATAKDPDSAKKLADVVNGLKALGQLAVGDQNPDLVSLLNGVTISQNGNQVGLTLNFPYDLLEKLQQNKLQLKKI